MEIIECPKCGRPRALGHRCPSCGDAATASDKQASTESDPWRSAATRPDAAFTADARPAAKPRRQIRWSLVVTVVVGVAVIAAIAVPMTRDGGASEGTEADSLASTADALVAELTGEDTSRTPLEAAEASNSDARALSVLSKARQTMDSIIRRLESSDEYTLAEYEGEIREALKSTTITSLRWEWGGPGVHARPVKTARADEYVVSWDFVPPASYEVGTWSASGAAIGLRVDGADGSFTFYKDGIAGF